MLGVKNKMNIFISHNKKDKDIAREIALFLVAENINLWFDEWEISAGDSIIEEIQSGLQKASHFLILWSQNAATSNWVRKELSSILMKAIENKNPKVIPIILDDTPLPELIRDLKYLRYHDGNEQDRKEIIKSITGHSPSLNFIRAIVKKYQEVIHDDCDPLGIAACPRCGSPLKKGMYTDYERDKNYFFAECTECNYSDWTQR